MITHAVSDGARIDEIGRPRFASARFDPVVLYVTPEQARRLDPSVPGLIASARRQLAARAARGGLAVILDLSEMPSAPPMSPLLRLVSMLHRACGPDPAIEITATSPELAAELSASGLPNGIVVTDRGGRRWARDARP